MDKDKEKVKLLDGSIYNIDSIFVLFNLLKITFSEEIADNFVSNMELFKKIELITRSGEICGEFSDYTTVYLIEGKKTLILSNDNSVYVKPDDPDYSVGQPYVPTIDDIKLSKINELSGICNELITNGVNIDVNGIQEHFSYKSEDQTNIKDAFDLALQTGLDIPYHCDSGQCKLYTSEQIINLYITQKMNLTHHTTYFNQMKMHILSLENEKEIKSISYGDKLTGIYLDTYNTMMGKANEVIVTLLNERSGA